MTTDQKRLNEKVQEYWQAEPCGKSADIVGTGLERNSRAWIDRVEDRRYEVEPGGKFIGMFYQRPSLVTLRVWLKFGLFAGKPWRTFRDVLHHHVESIGTKAYTVGEMRRMFGAFNSVSVQPILTEYDTRKVPAWLKRMVPERFGWFLAIKAGK